MSNVLISMSDLFLTHVDRMAESEGRSRSELIREAMRQYIARKDARASMVNRDGLLVG